MNISAVARQTPKAQPRVANKAQDHVWKEAGELLGQHGIPAEDHTLMQENIATYLAHRTDGELSPRWQGKLKRELATPYTDTQVHARIEHLEDSLQACLRELPAIPSAVYISGSFVKGRLGANSDLNGFAVVEPEHMTAGYDSYEERKANPDSAGLLPLSKETPHYNQGQLLMTGKSLKVAPEQIFRDGFLKATYENVQATRTPEDRRETHPLYEKATSILWSEDKSAKDKRDTFENPSFMTRVQNGILALGGALSTTPLIGPVVNKVADFFVSQDHQDLTADQNWVDAGALMESAGIESQDHGLMQRNLATYLAHRLSGTPSRRWQVKIDRDLAQPYTDEQVFQRIEQVQTALSERIASSGAMPSQLYVAGAFAKGRFSPHEELDTLNVVSPDQYDQVLEQALVRENQSDVHYFPLASNQPHQNQGILMVDGATRAVPAAEALEPGFLEQEYRSILSERKAPQKELQPRLEKWLGKAHRSRYDNTSLHSRLMRTAVTAMGFTSQVPLLGPLVKGAFAWMVPQDHR